MGRKLSDIKTLRVALLTLSVLVIVSGGYLATKLDSSFSLDQFALEHPEELESYKKYNRLFSKGDAQLIIGLKSKVPFENIKQFQKLEDIRVRIDSLQGVHHSYFLTNVDYKSQYGPVVVNDYFLPLKNEDVFNLHNSSLDEYPDITPKFISSDRTKVCIYITLNNKRNKEGTLYELRKLLSSTDYAEKHIIGKSITEESIRNTVQSESVNLTLIGLSLMLFFFLLFYPSVRSLLFFAWLILLSVSIFYISIWILGVELNTLTSTVPLLITVLALSDTVHILNSFKNSENRPTKGQIVFKKIGVPLMLTTITTALGFTVFILTGFQIIIEFSLIAILGILTSYLVARFFSPFLFFLLTHDKRQSLFNVDLIISKINLFSQKRAPLIVLFSTGVFIIGSYFAYNSLHINHFIYGQLKQGSEQEKSIEFYEQNFGGTRNISLFITSNNSMLHPDGIEKIEEIEKYLQRNYGASSITSINTAIKRYNRFKHAGIAKYFKIPENLTQNDLNKVYNLKSELGLGNSISKDKKSIRIIAQSPDEGSQITIDKNKQLQTYLNKLLGEQYNYYLGGPTTIQDKAITNITTYILYGIFGAILLVFIFLSILFKSIFYGFVGVVANGLPLIGVLLLYVIFQVDLNPTNVMLLSIVLGVAIDDTIYLLGNLFSNQKNNHEGDVNLQLQKNLVSTGKPIVVTTMLLIAGFFALYFSAFESNQENSLFFMFALGFALFADLLFVPAILAMKFRNKVR